MWLQEPGCFCPAMIEKGFQWLIKTTDLDVPRVTCQQYCAKYDCPGRGEGGSCEASRKGAVCTTAFGEPSGVLRPCSGSGLGKGAKELYTLLYASHVSGTCHWPQSKATVMSLSCSSASWSYLKTSSGVSSFHEGLDVTSHYCISPSPFHVSSGDSRLGS